MNRYILPTFLGLAHGVADGATGLLLGSLPHSMSVSQVGALVLLYNLLALGGQPSAGLLTDRLRRPRAALMVGLWFVGVGLIVMGWSPIFAVVLTGIGSAAFHVGGGALALCAHT